MTPLRILMITAEYTPLAKTGGLADMVAGLSARLAASGHDVCVVMPRYRGLEVPGDAAAVPQGNIPVAGGISPVALNGTYPRYEFICSRTAAAPQICQVDAPDFFSGNAIYGGGNTEALRFALLSHAALALCQQLGWAPHIVHCHDWHASLAPLLLNTYRLHEPLFRDASSVLTIHNIGYQGVFPAALANKLGLTDPAPLLSPVIEGPPTLNFLRAGIAAADALTTVSPTHAAEVLTPEYGKGLDELLRQRRNRLVGILNGVDYAHWDPVSDPRLPHPYGPGDITGKLVCRAELRKRSGLSDAGDVPILGMVSRLAAQKGIELVLHALPPFLRDNSCQAVVLGEGDPPYAEALQQLAADMPGRFAFIPAHSESIARLIFAGSDAFLVPSLYEPCGLTQMYALRYGSVPIVRDTGGLRDTVTHFDPHSGIGTGSVFRDADTGGLSWAISQVLAWHQQPSAWQRLRQNGMQADFSWAHQTPHYLALYRRLAGLQPQAS
ncbi:MAG: starch synthase [Pseudomonadota bacterium]|nr:starch synthase [Pseudomonadota bacterium]